MDQLWPVSPVVWCGSFVVVVDAYMWCVVGSMDDHRIKFCSLIGGLMPWFGVDGDGELAREHRRGY